MAKRSDFAQKLLDDLRLRKEKMSSASSQSQRSSQSHLPIDAYSYSKQTSVGSRKTKASEIVTSRTGDMLNRSSRSYRPPKNGEVSNQIVSYGRGQSQFKIDDVSLAIAFAFENGGKPRRAGSSYSGASSTMGFLHQIQRGTMEFSMMERQGNLVRQQGSSNRFQVLSPVQINEISRGAQKLNQILRACSNGVNIDRYSFEIAKELFQGAIDLEESLRVLVDLQQSSEFMITPQKKNRIRLLEEDSNDDDDDENQIIKVPEKNQLAPPIFSFDKGSKHALMQRQITLTNSKEGRNSNNKKQDGRTSKASQKQHTRSNSDIKNHNTLLEQKNQSSSPKSNTEKGRIPNVIAKLMGLDNIPEKVEPRNTPQKIRGTENLQVTKRPKVKEAFNTPATEDKDLVLIHKASSNTAAVHNGKPQWSELYGTKALHDFGKAAAKIDKQHNGAAPAIPISEGKGRKQDPAPTNNTQQKSTVKSRTNDPTLTNMLYHPEQVNERSQVKPSLQEEKGIKASNPQPVKGHANKQTMNNQNKSQNLGVHKSYTLSKYGPQEEKRHREQQREKQTLPVRPQGGSELASKNSSKNQHRFANFQKKQLNQATPAKQNFAESAEAAKLGWFSSSHYDDIVKHETSNDTNGKVKEINNRKSGGIIKMVDERTVHTLANMKVKNTRKQKTGMLGKIDKVLNERNGRKLITKQVEQQIPISQESTQGTPDRLNVLKEANQERVGMWKEADARIISSNESVAVAEDGRPPTHKEAERDQVALAPNESYQYMQSVTIDDLKDHSAAVAAGEEFKTGEIVSSTINGIYEDNSSQLQDQNISTRRTQQPLTESENWLKRILVTSRLFLSTAEALFIVDVPSGIMEDGDQENEGECKKLTLDCGYEVMKRKGIRTELKVLPCPKIPTSTANIASLDDLVRQLNKDMEKLQSYGRDKSSQANIEDYLPKMLELDVYGREPDIDCMWDFGWSDEAYALIEKHHVIKDLEKHILNVLLDEITRELLHV